MRQTYRYSYEFHFTKLAYKSYNSKVETTSQTPHHNIKLLQCIHKNSGSCESKKILNNLAFALILRVIFRTFLQFSLNRIDQKKSNIVFLNVHFCRYINTEQIKRRAV